MKMPLVSVAIITYNQVNYVLECIDSVLEQDYPNIEIVVGDDGSTDGTQQILKKYKEQHPEKFILKLADKNYGITANSNAVHFACTGKYIAWMGGDDLMLSGKIKRQVRVMEDDPDCNIVYHNIDVFDSETKDHLYFFNNKKNCHEGTVKTVIKYGTFNGACSNMVRKSMTPKDGYDTDLPVASDWLYWVETLIGGGTINYIDEVLARYRRHSKNVTNSFSEFGFQANKDHIKACEKILKYNPKFYLLINYRLSKVYRDMRKYNYSKYLIKSLKCRPTLKSAALLFLYLTSLASIRK